jgi:GntR family transcriptional regulator
VTATASLFILNPHAGIPIYRQLIDQVRRLVASGALKPGDALPSIRDLAREHAVNPMTISKAYSLLEVEGLLEHQRGRPMTVSARARQSRDNRLAQIDAQVEQLALAARQLQLTKKQVVDLFIQHWERTHV